MPPFNGKFQVDDICRFTAIADVRQEIYQSFINLAGHDVSTIRNMLFLLYLGNYDKHASHEMAGGNSTTATQTYHGEDMTPESSIHDEMYKHLRVYVTAGMFGIDDLKKILRNCLAWWLEKK